MAERKKGTRCKVCTYCGRCFTDEAPGDSSSKGWSGKRCDVCVGCGKCAEEWGLLGGDDADAVSGPTSWADAFKVMDIGTAGQAPPVPGAPGASCAGETVSAGDASGSGDAGDAGIDAVSGATVSSGESRSDTCGDVDGADDVDAVTGATPGVASACKELGLDDIKSVADKLGIKPPGQS